MISNKIILSIPQPCHENWEEMNSVEKGKFCNSCQKKVFDFTKVTDREIIKTFEQNNKLCGRFLVTQLNRDLLKPKRKNNLKLAITTAIISLLGLNEVNSQEPVKTEQTDRRILGKFIATPIKIVGKIIDDYSEEKIPEVLIQIKNKDNIIYSDDKGCFEVTLNIGDVLVFSKKDFTSVEIPINSKKDNLTISMKNKNIIYKSIQVTLGGAIATCQTIKKRTFFGRIFQSIGNWFR